MEWSLLLESLDSLWFFSNLLSSTTEPRTSLSSEGIANCGDSQKPFNPIVHSQQNEPPKAEFSSPRKPSPPIGPSQQKPSPRTEFSFPLKQNVHSQQNESKKAESLSPRCTKCGKFAVDVELPSVPVESIISEEYAKKEERISRRRRDRSKRKILGELATEFGDNGICMRDYGAREMNYKANASVLGMFRSQVKMPPLRDGMAMKRHLKSWAYAVACTVR